VDRVRALVWSSGIYGEQIGARAGFLWEIRFHLLIFIPQIAPQSPSCHLEQVQWVSSGRSAKWPQSHHDILTTGLILFRRQKIKLSLYLTK
jgi:hypothetical protein